MVEIGKNRKMEDRWHLTLKVIQTEIKSKLIIPYIYVLTHAYMG